MGRGEGERSGCREEQWMGCRAAADASGYVAPIAAPPHHHRGGTNAAERGATGRRAASAGTPAQRLTGAVPVLP